MLAKASDAIDREVRKRYEEEIEAEITRHSAAIAQARFAVLGDTVYPDATFTLRVSYGTVKGWMEDGVMVEPYTTIAGLYARHSGSPPYKLPDRWLAGRLVVVLGGEGRGIRPGVRECLDHRARIPMAGRVGSLNVSTAGAVVLFELLRRARARGERA